MIFFIKVIVALVLVALWVLINLGAWADRNNSQLAEGFVDSSIISSVLIGILFLIFS